MVRKYGDNKIQYMNHKSGLFRLRKGRFFLPIIKSSYCGLQTMEGLPLRGNIVTSRVVILLPLRGN